MTPPNSFNEPLPNSGVLISEAPGTRSREQILLAQSGAERTVTAGRLLGRKRGAVGAPAAFAAATDGRNNTGNGTFAATPTAGASCKEGRYKVVLLEPAANAGAFGLFDPDGVLVGTGNVASAYAGPHLAFTLQDGSTDFVAGDGFNIDVAEGTTYAEWDEDGTDGTEIPRAILLDAVDVPAAADARGVALVRDAEVNAAEIGWPASGTTDNEKAAALAALLAATGIRAR